MEFPHQRWVGAINKIMKKFQNKYRIPSARAVWWNYSNEGCYFVTICCHNMQFFFGNVINCKMKLSPIGKLAHEFWAEIPDHFPFVKLHAFVVMPNHVHGIIEISNNTGETLHATSVTDAKDAKDVRDATSVTDAKDAKDAMDVRDVRDAKLVGEGCDFKNEKMAAISPKKGSLASIVRSYKSAVSKEARKIKPSFKWQTRFYDHIIRDDQAYIRISNYIDNNPRKWGEDKFKR